MDDLTLAELTSYLFDDVQMLDSEIDRKKYSEAKAACEEIKNTADILDKKLARKK